MVAWLDILKVDLREGEMADSMEYGWAELMVQATVDLLELEMAD